MTKAQRDVRDALAEADGDPVLATHRALKALDPSKLSTKDAAAVAALLSKCLAPHDLLALLLERLPDPPPSNVVSIDARRR